MDDPTIVTNNGDFDESTDRSDEITADIISLMHSSTHASYVTCSQLSLKLMSYLSDVRIQQSEWKDLSKAVEVIVFYVVCF